MPWSGDFVFGDAWAAYRGPAAQNTPHAHAAIQLVLTRPEDVARVAVVGRDGRDFAGPALVIRPLVSHVLRGEGNVGLLYIEQQSPVGRALLSSYRGEGDIAALAPVTAASIDVSAHPQAWLDALSRGLPAAASQLDPRLERALRFLGTPSIAGADAGPGAIARAAAHCGLSPSRLRTLAREQIGLSLSTWLLWRKLAGAARTLQAGASLGEAAAAGGFADQAHFARTMRRMFGMTPREASRALV